MGKKEQFEFETDFLKSLLFSKAYLAIKSLKFPSLTKGEYFEKCRSKTREEI